MEQPEFVADFGLHWRACLPDKLPTWPTKSSPFTIAETPPSLISTLLPVMTEPLGQRTAIDSLWWERTVARRRSDPC